MNDKSGRRPSKDREERLSSFCSETVAKLVLLASSPNWSSCCSKLGCFLGRVGVEVWEEEPAEDCKAVAGPSFPSSLPSSSKSWESIQVDRLTTNRSLISSSSMEVSFFSGFRSRPSRSAVRVNDSERGERGGEWRGEERRGEERRGGEKRREERRGKEERGDKKEGKGEERKEMEKIILQRSDVNIYTF